MDADKPVSLRDSYVGLTNTSADNLATTHTNGAQQAAPPSLYAGSSLAQRFLPSSSPAVHVELSASPPQWESKAGGVDLLAKETGTPPSQASSGVAHASSSSPAMPLAAEQVRRNKVKQEDPFIAKNAVKFDALEAAIKAGDLSTVVKIFDDLDRRTIFHRLLTYTNYGSMADAVRSGDERLLGFFLDNANDSTFTAEFYASINIDSDTACGNLLDIAASRSDIKIGLLLVENGAQPGRNCPQQFLDTLLEHAIASQSVRDMQKLLGLGADWNLFFYSKERCKLSDETYCAEFLKPALCFHQKAGNKQVLLDILWLRVGAEAENRREFDKVVGQHAKDEDHSWIKFLMKMRSDVVKGDHAKITSAMMEAIKAAARLGRAPTLEILLDYQMAVCNEGGNASKAWKPAFESLNNFSFSDLLECGDYSRHGTLLHEAAYSGDADTVALLLSWGANLRALDRFGMSPLACAIYRNHTATAVVLLRAALEATGSWPGKKEMIRSAIKDASPKMKKALANAYAEVQPGSPAKVAARSYEPHWDL
jgi:ankyrin repeat protein